VNNDNKRGDLARLRAQLKHTQATAVTEATHDMQLVASSSSPPTPSESEKDQEDAILLPSKYAQGAHEYD
jgi:hypothetical protein